MSYIVKLPASFLALRLTQLGINVLVLGTDASGIYFLSQDNVLSYGPLAWGIWTIVFTFVVLGFSIWRVKSRGGIQRHYIPLILDCLLFIKWFVLWAYLAASIALVTSEQEVFYGNLDVGLTASMGAETGLAVIQWILCIVALVMYIIAWRTARREHQNQQPAPVLVAPGKTGGMPMNQQGAGSYPAPGVVYVQANAQPGLQQAVPAGQPVQYVAQPGAYQLQQQYALQPTVLQMPPNQTAYPLQAAQYGGPPLPSSMSPVPAGQPPSYQPAQMMLPYQQQPQYQEVQRSQQTPPQHGMELPNREL